MTSIASTATDSSANAAAIVLIILGIIAYWVPSIVGLFRAGKIPHVGSIIVINLFLGWTVIGWVWALAMAVRSKPAPQYLLVQQPPAPPTDG